MKSFICILFTILIIAVLDQGSCYLYSAEDPYSEFLNKNSEVTERHISGFNIKITDEALNSLANKLQSDLDRDGEGDEALFQGGDESDEFEKVDLTNWDSVEGLPEDSDPMELVDMKINTKVGKREFVYSKIFSTSGKGQKSFSKVYQSSKEGGEMSSEILGSLNTTLSSTSSGKIDSNLNTTMWVKGKASKYPISTTSTLTTNSTEKKLDKRGYKIGANSNLDISTTVTVSNMTIVLNTNMKTNAETFRAPFGIYLTLFDSRITIGGKVNETADIRGEVTSRVIFAKHGKSLTKSTIRGVIVSHVEQPYKASGVSTIKSTTHTWTKVVKSNETNNGEIVVDICTSMKTRVYGKATVQGMKVFSGSGIATFKKVEVVIPVGNGGGSGTGHEHEYGVNFIVKHLLNDYFSSVRQLSGNVLNV